MSVRSFIARQLGYMHDVDTGFHERRHFFHENFDEVIITRDFCSCRYIGILWQSLENVG